MTLRRENKTPAERITLPTYATFSLIVGVSFLLTPLSLLRHTPGLEYADQMAAGLRGWGAAFLALSFALWTALTVGSRRVYVVALCLFIAWMGGWALLLLGAAIWDDASWSAWAWPGGYAVLGFASLVSLRAGEK